MKEIKTWENVNEFDSITLCPNSKKMAVIELRKQDNRTIVFIQNYPRVMNVEPIGIFLRQKGMHCFGTGRIYWIFFMAWMTYFPKPSTFLWTHFMLTDLVSVPVNNLSPFSSKFTLNYLLYENRGGPCKHFSFSIWHDVKYVSRSYQEKHRRRKRSSSSFWSTLLSTFLHSVWPLHCQASAARRSQQHLGGQQLLPAPPSVTSQ